jgi:hypothetical protein
MRSHSLLQAIDIMGRNAKLDDAKLVSALKSAGFSDRDSQILVAFVPTAFARPVLERLGVEHFAESVSAPTGTGNWVDIPLKSISIYNAALAIARRRAGAINPDHFEALAMRSAELDSASRALDAGANVKGSAVATALVHLTAGELGYGSWLGKLRRGFGV